MKRNLQAVLSGVPSVRRGVAGVSAAISAVNAYMRKHGLMEVGSGGVDRAISEAVGYRVEDVHYSPGGIRRRASYRMARITGRAEFEAHLFRVTLVTGDANAGRAVTDGVGADNGGLETRDEAFE